MTRLISQTYNTHELESIDIPCTSTTSDYTFVNQKIIDRANRKLEDQIWFHGKIKRITAINLLKKNGDFLVRDSISNQGNYVLSGMCNNEVMHFEINRAPSSDPYNDLYFFEDEQFRSVIDLIEFYYNYKRQVTAKSQFLLLNPIQASNKSDSSILNRFQLEIEATYAPFITKQLQYPTKYDRSLSHTVILNQAKKRINNNENVSKEKVTTFGITDNDDDVIDENLVKTPVFIPPPPMELRPVPNFSPPKPNLRISDDIDDYDQLDYSTMESIVGIKTPPKKYHSTIHQPSPPELPPKPACLKTKRYSDFMDTIQGLDEIISEPKLVNKRQPSSHSLFNVIESTENVDEENLPAYLDRTQSLSNLVSRQRCRMSKNSDDEQINIKKYPSIKIEPGPMLPTRSNTSLNSLSALTQILNEKRTDKINFDYDDLKKNEIKKIEKDYDYLKENEKPYNNNNSNNHNNHNISTMSTDKTRLFIQNKTTTNISKSMKNLLNYLSSLSSTKLSLMLTSEDIKIFNLNETMDITNNIKKLFMFNSNILHDGILDRNACIQLIVIISLNKSTTPNILTKLWILTSAHLLYKIGNGFSFGAIMTALKSEFNKKPKFLLDIDQPVVSLYKGLLPIYDDYINGKMPPIIAGCFLPFIQPLLYMLNKSDYVETNKTKNFNLNGLNHLDVLSNLILLSRHILFENESKTTAGVQGYATFNDLNPLSTESLIHCILNTSTISDIKESDKKKIRQLLDLSI